MFGASPENGEIELIRVLRALKDEFPSFHIVKKSESKLMWVIDVFLRVITFGKMKTFRTKYITTIGNTVYVSESWADTSSYAKAIVLRHERVHMRQARAMSFPLFAFLYLFVPLPGGLAYCRTVLEMQAYRETLAARAEYYGLLELQNPTERQLIISHFTGPAYFWMWPFQRRVEDWYDNAVLDVMDNYLSRKPVDGEKG